MTYAARSCRHSRPIKTIVLGAGVIGISTAWHLLELGHEVTVLERQPRRAAESFEVDAQQRSPIAVSSAPALAAMARSGAGKLLNGLGGAT